VNYSSLSQKYCHMFSRGVQAVVAWGGFLSPSHDMAFVLVLAFMMMAETESLVSKIKAEKCCGRFKTIMDRVCDPNHVQSVSIMDSYPVVMWVSRNLVPGLIPCKNERSNLNQSYPILLQYTIYIVNM